MSPEQRFPNSVPWQHKGSVSCWGAAGGGVQAVAAGGTFLFNALKFALEGCKAPL